MAYPAIQSITLSFFKWQGYGPWVFVGLSNFIKTFTKDLFFYTALKNSIIFSITATAGTVIIGFILATLIDLKIHFWKIYRFIFFLPVIISGTVVSLLWMKLVDNYGLINYLLDILNLGILKHAWLGDPKTVMFIIIIVCIWWQNGFPMLFFLAGMQNIDDNIYKAAKIDGASTIRIIFSITIPLLKNTFSIIIALQLIFSFKVFDIIWIMTQGGPAGASEVLGTRLYESAFKVGQLGYASVISVIMFFVAIIFSIVYVRISGYYQKSN